MLKICQRNQAARPYLLHDFILDCSTHTHTVLSSSSVTNCISLIQASLPLKRSSTIPGHARRSSLGGRFLYGRCLWNGTRVELRYIAAAGLVVIPLQIHVYRKSKGEVNRLASLRIWYQSVIDCTNLPLHKSSHRNDYTRSCIIIRIENL